MGWERLGFDWMGKLGQSSLVMHHEKYISVLSFILLWDVSEKQKLVLQDILKCVTGNKFNNMFVRGRSSLDELYSMYSK